MFSFTNVYEELDSFFWKKENSANNGIIVTSLPPITKPPMRFETIEIDGKDGDITNLLGYSSYIKKIDICLNHDRNSWDNSQIDYIINWLSGESNITFSNEYDKYYEGIILNQIDYDDLIKFKIASVNVKVQPFKYSISERKITKSGFCDIYNPCYLDALPIITFTGNGLIHLLINNSEVCQININERITIDSIIQDAYKDDKNNLANRNMNGTFPVLKKGSNSISWYGEGVVTQIEVKYRSRWL